MRHTFLPKGKSSSWKPLGYRFERAGKPQSANGLPISNSTHTTSLYFLETRACGQPFPEEGPEGRPLRGAGIPIPSPPEEWKEQLRCR